MHSRPADATLEAVIRGGAKCGAMRGDIRGWGHRGSSVTRILVALTTTLVIAYAASVLLPPVIASFRFSQAMMAETTNGPINEPVSFIHGRLVGQADRLGLDIVPEQVVVQKNGPRVAISADYVIPVHLLGGISFDWRLRPHKEGVRRPGLGG